jgi:hypothetical protein
MFHLTPNHRSYQLSFILNLVWSFLQTKAWPVAALIVLIKGKTGPANMAETIKALFNEDKVYSIGEKKVTQGEIIAKAEAWDAKHAKAKFPQVCEGRHRVVALWIVNELFGVAIEPDTIEVDAAKADEIAFQTNLTNENIAKMLSTEKLQGIVELVKANVYKKQTDLPVKRGQQQKLWHAAQAVIVQGTPVEQAAKLSYKEAKDVVDGKVTADDAIAARGNGNQSKVLPGEKIRELLTMAKNYDKDGANELYKLLDAIVNNAETTAKAIVVGAYKVAKA